MAVFLSDFLPDTDSSGRTQALDQDAAYKLVGTDDILAILKPRKSFSHKGTYGHALLIAGDVKTMGAALLCATGCIYGGAGLTTVSIPEAGLTALNTLLPEAMYLERSELLKKEALNKYHSIAIGPGLGKGPDAVRLTKVLIGLNLPLVADADALNILAEHPEWSHKLEKDTVITPHLKEFDTLFGQHQNWADRLNTGREMAKKLGLVIVLKNQYTFIIDQEGQVNINPTGNPAMSQGGMGDVLTGLIAAYIAQGYGAKRSAILACYLHGKAGDELAETHYNITASQLAARIPATVKLIIDSAVK